MEVDPKYHGMAWKDLVRKYIPDATEQECDYILWTKTAFPMDRPEQVELQIKEFAEERQQEREYYESLKDMEK